jgi:cell division protein FtsB
MPGGRNRPPTERKKTMMDLSHMRTAVDRTFAARIRGLRPAAWDRGPLTSAEVAARRQEGHFLRKLWQSSREQWRRTAVLGVLVWAAYAILFSPGGTFHVIRLRHHAERVEQEVARLASACDSLEQVIRAVEGGDPTALERVAREEYGFVRGNERIYVLPSDALDRRLVDRSRSWTGSSSPDPATGR